MHFSAIQAWLRESPPVEETAVLPSSSVSFVELWTRIAGGACAVLAASLPDQPEVTVLNDLRESLTLRLSEVGEGPVWEHFNKHRPLNALVMAQLDTDERGCRRTIYCRVMEALRADGLQALTAEYPVLRRHLTATVTSWLESSGELLLRVQQDHQMLTESFAVPADARLIAVKTGISDPHRGGRSVAILTFAAEPAIQASIVYKPRDLRLEAQYHQLISDVSATMPDAAPLRSLTVLALDGYGYVEHVTHEICGSDEELAKFYRNAGRLTAILYVLGCNDCHNENVIAHRDQLILVDAETLLQGVPGRAVPDPASATARDSLEARVGDSVVRIGLLPHWFFIGGERIPRDVSALGIEPPADAPMKFTGWSALNSDGMLTGPITRPARLPMSLPVGMGSPNRLSDFATDYRDGFRRQLEAIAADKEAWLGHLERFRGLRGRFVRRPTWIYLWMRGRLLEAAALRDEAGQSEALTGLGKPKRADRDGHDDTILIAERAQLGELDVPYFEHATVARDLALNDTDMALDFFAQSGLDAARRRIMSLGADDIQLQLAFIDGLMAAKARRAHGRRQRDPSAHHLAIGALSAKQRLDAAIAVGDMLVDTSLTDDSGNVEWLGIDSALDLERSCYGPIGPTLYGGRVGIALFLATLAGTGSEPQADIYRQVAKFACADIVRLLVTSDASDKRMWWRDQPLGLAGSGGQLLAAILLRGLVPEMHRAVSDGLSALLDALDPEIIVADNDLDIIFGCSGLIGPLLRIGTPRAMDLARAAGDRLVKRQDGEGGWIVPSLGPKALTGFSHGASGGAAALAKLATATSSHPYLDAAQRALEYERAQFDSHEKNWPDYRNGAGGAEPPFMLSWCHGAPGIAMARLCLKSTPLWDKETESDLELALTATTDATRLDDSLCCGRFGRAAILRAAHDRGGGKHWLAAAEHLEAQALAQIHGDGGYSFGDVLGLFQGAAGIGLGLLDGLSDITSAVAPRVLSAGLID